MILNAYKRIIADVQDATPYSGCEAPRIAETSNLSEDDPSI